ncbi:unnamed protein product [Paramecium sonneborni]|uniref:Protein kinase domain-containing protein n=1 Tax=Paramecium sonneborni TaxID=65129 RepID=A0A8S1N2V4_9CILI|nr:unnamed protein product [Paramecium sonneborni]
MNQHFIKKNDLIPTQLDQLKKLRSNLKKLKNSGQLFLSESLQILEKEHEFVFINNEIENSSEIQQYVIFGNFQGNQNHIKFAKHLLIERLIDQLIDLKNYGIHLPMLNESYFYPVRDEEFEIFPNYKIQKLILCKFGFENLLQGKGNQELINNKNIPSEINEDIEREQASKIQFNEKMTVFALGCMIYYILFQQNVHDNKSNSQSQQQANFMENQQSLLSQQNIENIESLEPALKKIITDCIKVQNEDRPTLKDIKKEYSKIIFQYQFQFLERLKIRDLTEKFVNPNEQITGRLIIMEFLTKIKFVLKYFKNINDSQNYKTLIILELICQEQDKLKLENNELKLWDQNNTKDEIDEFKIKYLNKYQEILDQLIDIIMKDNQNMLILIDLNSIKKRELKQLSSIIQQSIKICKNDNDSDNLRNKCLQNINNVFVYEKLLEQFTPLQIKQIGQENKQEQIDNDERNQCYDRYDRLINILFDDESGLHKEILLTLNQKQYI